MADERQAVNARVVEQFRAHGGVLGGVFAGLPLLLLTTTGARSGEPRIVPLSYVRDGARLVVAAANGGRETHPGWYHNVLATPAVAVEVGTDRFPASASTLVAGAEYERLWQAHVTALPQTADYATAARAFGRCVPLVVLSGHG